jgi:hypothetical protein
MLNPKPQGILGASFGQKLLDRFGIYVAWEERHKGGEGAGRGRKGVGDEHP